MLQKAFDVQNNYLCCKTTSKVSSQKVFIVQNNSLCCKTVFLRFIPRKSLLSKTIVCAAKQFLRFHPRNPLQHCSYSSHLQARLCCWKRKDGFYFLIFLNVQSSPPPQYEWLMLTRQEHHIQLGRLQTYHRNILPCLQGIPTWMFSGIIYRLTILITMLLNMKKKHTLSYF